MNQTETEQWKQRLKLTERKNKTDKPTTTFPYGKNGN